jgi:DNA-binding CsgD family transcriptional regulator
MGRRGAGPSGGAAAATAPGDAGERQARLLDDAVGAALARGDLPTARRQLSTLTALPFSRTSLGAALATAAAALVALATDRPVNADALATAASEHARAAASPPLEARALLLAGRAQAALGADDVAAERFSEAERVARRAGDRELLREAHRRRVLVAPASEPAAAETTGLSARQLEIAQLVAEGGTNREVADALGISEHTVNTHLRAAFRRLGVSRRGALAEALARPRE